MASFYEENKAELNMCPVVTFSNLEVWLAAAGGGGGGHHGRPAAARADHPRRAAQRSVCRVLRGTLLPPPPGFPLPTCA
jgi:hypothetical protein